MQRFNGHKRNGRKAQVQHQCSMVAFFDALGFLCTKILGNIRAKPHCRWIQRSMKKHFPPSSLLYTRRVPVYRKDLPLPAQSSYRWTLWTAVKPTAPQCEAWNTAPAVQTC